MALFQSNSQEWFNLDCIELVSDFGWDIAVTLKNGKVCRIDGSDRDRFKKAMAPLCLPEDREPPPETHTTTFTWYPSAQWPT